MAIPTKYDGIEYRSRLEARWAAFMQNIGWNIVYEPFDGDGYIPDFLVQGDNPLLIEVKPASVAADYQAAVPKAERGLAAHWTHDILIVGSTPFPTVSLGYGSQYPAGLLGEYAAAPFHTGWIWDEAEWHQCTLCQSLNIHHTQVSYTGRPCGHWGGNDYLGTPPTHIMRSMWADACNDVRWRGTAA